MEFLEYITPLSAFAAIYLIAMIFAINRIERRKAQKRDSAVSALDFVRRWNDNDYANKLRLGIDADRGVFHNSIDKGESDYNLSVVYAHNVLEFLEELAIAVRFGVVDEELTREFFQVYVIVSFQKFSKFIDDDRVKDETGSRFKNLERLYGRWVFSVVDKNDE